MSGRPGTIQVGGAAVETAPHERVRHAIAAHFRGKLDPRREQAMREHLPGCADCRRHYERYLRLGGVDPHALTPAARIARGLGLRPQRAHSPSVHHRFLVFGALAGAVVIALVALPRSGSLLLGAAGGGFVPRGAKSAAVSELLVYRASGPAEPMLPAGEVIWPADALAFAYRNPIGKPHLMIFGVDEHRHVYWYHPAWVSADENPTAVTISAAPGIHELPAAVVQSLDGGMLVIHALFSDRAFTVRDVEEMLRRRPGSAADAGPLAVPGTVDVSRTLRVAR